jgi:hypothetical protein
MGWTNARFAGFPWKQRTRSAAPSKSRLRWARQRPRWHANGVPTGRRSQLPRWFSIRSAGGDVGAPGAGVNLNRAACFAFHPRALFQPSPDPLARPGRVEKITTPAQKKRRVSLHRAECHSGGGKNLYASHSFSNICKCFKNIGMHIAYFLVANNSPHPHPPTITKQ